MGRARRREGAVWLMLLAMLPACGYTSAYAPMADGRARAVWKDDDVVMELSGSQPSPACRQALALLSPERRLRLSTGDEEVFVPEAGAMDVPVARPTPWVPIFFGAAIVARHPHLAPPPLPLVFASSLPLPQLVSGSRGTRVGAPSGSRGGTAGLGDGMGRLLVVLAVIAVLVLPALDLGLALAHPESPTRSSEAIDQVNLFNDWARAGGGPCAYGVP